MTIGHIGSISDHVQTLRPARNPLICMLAFGGDPCTNTLLLPSSFVRWREVPRSHPRIRQPTLSTIRRRGVKIIFSGRASYLPRRSYEVPPDLAINGRRMATPAAELAWMVLTTSPVILRLLVTSRGRLKYSPQQRSGERSEAIKSRKAP
jgi:hypothetical protein